MSRISSHIRASGATQRQLPTSANRLNPGRSKRRTKNRRAPSGIHYQHEDTPKITSYQSQAPGVQGFMEGIRRLKSLPAKRANESYAQLKNRFAQNQIKGLNNRDFGDFIASLKYISKSKNETKLFKDRIWSLIQKANISEVTKLLDTLHISSEGNNFASKAITAILNKVGSGTELNLSNYRDLFKYMCNDDIKYPDIEIYKNILQALPNNLQTLLDQNHHHSIKQKYAAECAMWLEIFEYRAGSITSFNNATQNELKDLAQKAHKSITQAFKLGNSLVQASNQANDTTLTQLKNAVEEVLKQTSLEDQSLSKAEIKLNHLIDSIPLRLFVPALRLHIDISRSTPNRDQQRSAELIDEYLSSQGISSLRIKYNQEQVEACDSEQDYLARVITNYLRRGYRNSKAIKINLTMTGS